MPPAKEIDALYGLPLEEFTNARNELARTLRTEGRRAEADEVAALRKPSLAAWVVNRLARDRGDEVRALIDAAKAIKAGDDDADDRFRAALDSLLPGARQILAATGRSASDSVLRQVATTLRASAATAPEELTAGRLAEAREATGFEAALAGTPPRPRRPKRAKGQTTERRQTDRAALDAARRSLTQARDAVREHRRLLAAAEKETRHAKEALEEAEDRVAEAERRLAELRLSSG